MSLLFLFSDPPIPFESKFDRLTSQSTPRITGAHMPKRSSLLAQSKHAATFSPVTPDLFGAKSDNFPMGDTFTPEHDERRVEVSLGAGASFCLSMIRKSRRESTRIELDIRDESNDAITKIFELFSVYTPYTVLVRIRAEWLIKKSSGAADFDHFVQFLSDCVNLTATHAVGSAAPQLKKTRNSSQPINSALIKKFWPSELINDLIGRGKDDAVEEESSLCIRKDGKLIGDETMLRILFLAHEELSTHGQYLDETVKLRTVLTQLSKAMGQAGYSSYLQSVTSAEISISVPNLTAVFHGIMTLDLGGVLQLPIDVGRDSRVFYILCLYSAAFIGLTVEETKEIFTSDKAAFVEEGAVHNVKWCPSLGEYNHAGTGDIELLLNHLSFCSVDEWTDIPSILLLPIMDKLREYRTDIPTIIPGLKGSIDNLYGILGRDEILNPSSLLDSVHCLEVDTAKWNGLDCLNSQNPYLAELFPKDLRTDSVSELLSSNISHAATEVGLDLTSERPDRIMALAEERLQEVSKRTVARTFGRGLAVLGSSKIIPIQKLQFPRIDLSLRLPSGYTSPDLGVPTSLTRHDLSDAWDEWPHYHNSCAAALSLSSDLRLEASWLLWNRPADYAEIIRNQSSHNLKILACVSGALLGLGLRGYLKEMEPMDAYISFMAGPQPSIYLASISIFIGLCANPDQAGGKNATLTSLLALHLPFLMPLQDEENALQTPLIVQCSAVISLGFLYKSTAHARYANLLIDEINRRPDHDRDSPNEREAYATSAGCALGLILLGKGMDQSLTNLCIRDRLRTIISGGINLETKANKGASYILEGNMINTWVTSSGAISAIALSFLSTGEAEIASWLEIPDSIRAVESITPINITLCTIGRYLILLDQIEPTAEWVDSLKPKIIAQNGLNRQTFQRWNLEQVQRSERNYRDKAFVPPWRPPTDNIDMSATATADLSITVGACFAIGLKYMGTQNEQAAAALSKITARILDHLKNDDFGGSNDFVSMTILEHALGTILLSWALIKSGSGDLELLRICRNLSNRLTKKINYGLQLALADAMGILFLGGCRYSLKNDLNSIAIMFIALMPKYPSHPNDNNQHLQALRHLAALPAEKRAIIPMCTQQRIIQNGKIIITLRGKGSKLI